MKNLLALLIVTVALIGCATHKTVDMLNSRMHVMTYEEALQRFGPPAQCAESGSTKVCTWSYGSGGAMLMPVGNMMVAAPMPGPSARLTFTNGVMTWWQLSGNWE